MAAAISPMMSDLIFGDVIILFQRIKAAANSVCRSSWRIIWKDGGVRTAHLMRNQALRTPTTPFEEGGSVRRPG
jgi:hypothetical protein